MTLLMDFFTFSNYFLSTLITEQDIYHERAWLHSRVDQVVVKCVVETTGPEHSNRMYEYLAEKGYPLVRGS
jgi:hypothetical protein